MPVAPYAHPMHTLCPLCTPYAPLCTPSAPFAHPSTPYTLSLCPLVLRIACKHRDLSVRVVARRARDRQVAGAV